MSTETAGDKLSVAENAEPGTPIGHLSVNSEDKQRYTFEIEPPNKIFEIDHRDDGRYYVQVKKKGPSLIGTKKDHSIEIKITDTVSKESKSKPFSISVRFIELPDFDLVPMEH